MTDILNRLDSSDNEEIKKLFLRCKPKLCNDVNLNRVSDQSRSGTLSSDKFSTNSGGSHNNRIEDVANEQRPGQDIYNDYVNENRTTSIMNTSFDSLFRSERLLSREYEQASHTNSRTNLCTGGNTQGTDNYNKGNSASSLLQNQTSSEPDAADQVRSIQSPNIQGSSHNLEHYGSHGRNSVTSSSRHPHYYHYHQHQERYLPYSGNSIDAPTVMYDEELDIGYRVSAANVRDSFQPRESRIEIAGGREVFTASRSRPAKKRFSDEILHHRPNEREMKRHSGEVLYDDQLSRYQIRTANRKSTKFEPAINSTTDVTVASGNDRSGCEPERSNRSQKFNQKITCDASDGLIKIAETEHLNVAADVKPLQSQPNVNNHAGGVNRKIHRSQKDNFFLKGQRGGKFIYEATVCGASEIVYDDIGEWEVNERNKWTLESGHHLIEDGSAVSDCLEKPFDSFQKQLNASTEAINSEEFISEREDGASSSQDDTSSPSSGSKLAEFIQVNNKRSNRDERAVEAMRTTPDRDVCTSSFDDGDSESALSSPDRKPITRLIGSLPIAQYDGSPRRYGPRPGHPERVTVKDTISGDVESTALDITKKCDLIEVYSANKRECNGVATSTPPLINTPIEENHQRSSEFICDNLDGDLHKSELIDGPVKWSDFSRQLYEESETRRVLEEFYRQDGLCAKLKDSGTLTAEEFRELEYRLYRLNTGNNYVGRRLAESYIADVEDSPKKRPHERMQQLREHLLAASVSELLGDVKRSSSLSQENILPLNYDHHLHQQQLRSGQEQDPDCETASTNPDTEDLGETEIGEQVGLSRNFTLSPETTDCDSSELSLEIDGSLHSSSQMYSGMPVLEDGLSSGHATDCDDDDSDQELNSEGNLTALMIKKQINEIEKEIARRGQRLNKRDHRYQQHHFQQPHVQPSPVEYREVEEYLKKCEHGNSSGSPYLTSQDSELEQLDPLRRRTLCSPPPSPAPVSHRVSSHHSTSTEKPETVSEVINEIKEAIRNTKAITLKSPPMGKVDEEGKPVWVLRPAYKSKVDGENNETMGGKGESFEEGPEEEECDTDQETDRLLGKQRTEDSAFFENSEKETQKKKGRTKEVLIEGVLFRARYLGSTQLVCEGQPTKATRMMQAEEAVSRIKAPEGETQPSTEVDLFISTEKIMVLNTDLKEIMMDHALRTISYIADIGDLVVLMARRRMLTPGEDEEPKTRRLPKMICHVFESDEAQFIAQSIGQAFQVAYMEFLKANGIEDHSFVKEMDYQEVLNSQEIYGDELEMFAKKEMQKEVIVPKLKGEILGVVIVESGWGSMLPTVVIANLSPNGAAARCGQLNIGDQIIAINGISLVGLPLSTCQTYIKNTKNQTVVKLTVVPCAPVVEVKIKRPDTKYQLGFSVQNGVICSLLRGGIAERGGVRVGHRIIEINGQSVVAVPHERIVNLLATSVGEIHMKTMPTSMFKLLTGQESPAFI
ncbi:hypothetical protein CHUAL_000436 [Chamberlinius hualienensis]